MIIARIESLILEAGLEDALQRAEAYVKAGADGILIHSKSKKPDEVIEFATHFRKQQINTIDCCSIHLPASDFKPTRKAGINVVIYANHLLRGSYPAMTNISKEYIRKLFYY